ncbi:MAG: prepilin-type N-terminal cleavage/methylation domain-containing protein [Ilumatobacter sp.]|nr:prepilin-type N-terminal cleavage/methylation domain-containing protein [Ilumatobacter sp.]
MNQRKDGFTLLETLVAVGMLGLVATALAAAITTFVRNEGSVTTRVTNSRDLQNLANFLPGDVASSRLMKSDTTGVSADAVTPSESPCGTGGDIILHLEWTEFWTTAYSARVTYRAFPDATNPTEVSRHLCQNGSAESSIVMARAFDTVSVELQRQSGDLTGTVNIRFDYPDGEYKRITGTSRHFLP